MQFFSRCGRVLLLSSLLVVGTVCTSGSAEKPAALVGQWVRAGGQDVGPKSMETFSDGTGVRDGKGMTWKVENKRLMLVTPEFARIYDYNLSGYELTLTNDDKESAVFVKKDKLEEYKRKKIEKISSYFTDSRNGQKYRAVVIGGKKWMAENLNYPAGNSWCYNNDNSKCAEYGRLYDWNTAKAVCPAGWHLPSNDEWDALEVAAGGGKVAGKALKSGSGWDKNGNGTDEYGFSALPGGLRVTNGKFDAVGFHGYWWTATGGGSGNAYRRYMIYLYGNVGEVNDVVSFGVSVRCVGD